MRKIEKQIKKIFVKNFLKKNIRKIKFQENIILTLFFIKEIIFLSTF